MIRKFTHRLRTMFRSINHFASATEEYSRSNRENWKGKVLNFILYSSVADRLLNQTLKTLAYNPNITFFAILVLYLIFCIIWFPLYLLSLAVSWWGSILCLICCIILGARSFARTIMFPGSTKSLQKQYSVDFMRRFSFQIEHFSSMASSFATMLLLLAGGKMARPAQDMAHRKFADIQHVLDEQLPDIAHWVQNATTEAVAKKTITAEEAEVFISLRSRVEELTSALIDIKPLAHDLLSMGSSASVYSSGNLKASHLLAACKKIMKICESLSAAAISVKPRSANSGNNNASFDGEDAGGGGGISAGILNSLKALTAGTDGPSGTEKLSFPLMREQMQSFFGGQRVQVMGCDDNIIDAIYVPCAAVYEESQRNVQGSDRSRAFQEGASRVGPASPMGTVLFCSPNAGLYECVSQASKDASWIGFYTKLGFDVCFFNYRGYGNSTGVPDPDRVKRDGLSMARFLKSERRVVKLLVHGESIGGLVATHVATVFPVDMLICDRTFASLDALASRLMGTWAGLGLRYVGMYRTNVVSDFLRSTCSKVLLQDPNDEIIHNAASLKNGIATNLLLGEQLWDQKYLKPEYTYAEFSGLPISQVLQSFNGQSTSSVLQNSHNLERPLNEEFIAHLTACLFDISRRSALATQARTMKTPAISRGLQGVGSPARGAAVNRSRSGDEDDVDEDELAEEKQLPYVLPAHMQFARDPVTQGAPASEWLYAFCAQNIFAASSTSDGSGTSLSPIEKVWIAIARVDGGSGQLLGQAMTGDLDGVRCWICSLLLWSSRAASDPVMPQGAFKSDLHKCIQDLSALASEGMHPQIVGSDESVSFVREALASITRRCMQIAQGKQGPFVHPRNTSGLACNAIEFCFSQLSAATGTVAAIAGRSQTQTYTPIGSSINTTPEALSESIPKEVDLTSLGRVIPVHCGHNGWPALALPALVECLRDAGFQVSLDAPSLQGGSHFPPSQKTQNV